MSFDFLSDADAERTLAVLQKLQRHAIHDWVLTGGLDIPTERFRLANAEEVLSILGYC